MPKKSTKKRGLFIVFAVLLAIWIACLTYIPYFGINRTTYFGLRNISRNEMDGFIYNNFLNKKNWLPANNYFFVNTEKIREGLNKKFAFDSIIITKKFPNQLIVEVKEKISSIIYDNGKKYFLLDSGGAAIKFLKDVEPHEYAQKLTTSITNTLSVSSTMVLTTTTIEHAPDYKKINKLFGGYPIIYDRRALEVEIKQTNILPLEHVVAVIVWYKALIEQGIAAPKFFVLDNLNSGVTIETEKIWNILFQPKNNNDAQIIALKEILPAIKPQEYVDLRFGEKVYWK